jgi:hypothetical protein
MHAIVEKRFTQIEDDIRGSVAQLLHHREYVIVYRHRVYFVAKFTKGSDDVGLRGSFLPFTQCSYGECFAGLNWARKVEQDHYLHQYDLLNLPVCR